MAIDWGLALGAASVIAVPVGFGITLVVGASPTRGEIRAARACFIFAAVAAMGSLAWLTYEQPLRVKIISAAIVGALSATGLVLGLDWIQNKEKSGAPETHQAPPPDQAQAHLVAEWRYWGGDIQPNATLLLETIVLRPSGEHGDDMVTQNIQGNSLQGAGVVIPPGHRVFFTGSCQITNYGPGPVFSIILQFDASFHEMQDQPDGSKRSAAIANFTRKIPWLVRKLDVGSNNSVQVAFINTTRFAVSIGLPTEITGTLLGNQKQKIALTQPGFADVPTPLVLPALDAPN
jgi:hypothetical protein